MSLPRCDTWLSQNGTQTHGPSTIAKAMGILAAKLARATYHLPRKKEVFDEAKALGG